MKHCFICVFLCSFIISFSNATYSPPLALVLMVKNEAAAMQPTLQPFLDAGINDYLILDTGSTDNTIQVTRDLFTTYTVSNGYIVEQPFVDFATSRNYALRCAEEKFPNAAFFLFIDAEWIMHNVTELMTFCKKHSNDTPHSYLIRGICDGADFFVQRLIRPHKGLFYKYTTQEMLNQQTACKVPHTICFNLLTTHYGIQKTKERWLRDCALLHKDLERNANDGHALFYLGQTYAGLENYSEAIKYYKMYCDRALPDEFSFMAHCRLADLYQITNNWEQALHYYLEAYNIRPMRAEPLVQIACYYLAKEQFSLSFLFAQKALEIPYPKDDIFLIDKNIYEYARYDIVSKAAYCLGFYEIGEAAIRQALQARPDNTQLQHIFRLYQERKNAQK